MAKGKQCFKGKQWEKDKGKKPQVKSFQGTSLPRTNAKSSRDDVCYYCGKPSHFAKNRMKRRSDKL